MSVLKYPWFRPNDTNDHPKFCFYGQADDLKAKTELLGNDPAFRTPECEVMDYADDVVYSVIDASDFYRLGMIDLVAHNEPGFFKEFIQRAQATPRSPFHGRRDSELDWDSLDRVRRALFDSAPPRYDGNTSVEREALQWMVNVMDYLTTSSTGSKRDRPFSIQPYELQDYKGQPVYRCSKRMANASAALDVLKALTWVYVINVSFDLEVMQRRAETMLSRLVWYYDLAMMRFRQGRLHQRVIFGPYIHLINRLDPANRVEHVRLAADIVASMTDAEAEYHYRVLNLSNFA